MKSLFFKVMLPLIGIVIMLFLVIVLDPIKPQDASTFIFSHADSCNNVHIEVSETNCSSSSTSYGTTATLSIPNMQGNISHTVNWVWLSYFCPESGHPNTDSMGKPSCLENKRVFSGTTVVDNQSHNNQPVSISNTPASFNMPQFAMCGTYQNDFFITSVDDNSNCTFGRYSTNENEWVTYLAGTCDTGNVCRAQQPPTPTTPVQPTATTAPTTPPTIPPTASPTPVIIPSSTPTPITTTSSGCNNTTQVGVNNNSNCNTNTQSQSQTQNNNQTVNVSLSGSISSNITPTPGAQQAVLAAATVPQLPNTGAETDILFGLIALAPIGWKIRKLV